MKALQSTANKKCGRMPQDIKCYALPHKKKHRVINVIRVLNARVFLSPSMCPCFLLVQDK